MRCTNCNTELIPGKRFCHNCGARAVATCANCGARVDPSFRFCPDCGSRMAVDASEVRTEAGQKEQSDSVRKSEPAPTNGQLARLSRHIPEGLAQKIRSSTGASAGERKLVTVLFCDLVGSTSMAEQLDPEEYHDLLEQYLELAFREIYRFEGIVNQLAGDGMMALFGAPVAHEDAPERALRAALAIREALGRFNEDLQAQPGLQLRARVGIHTGPVVVGPVGNDFKMDYTAIGDTTNLASRLESLAQPGTILVSEATARLVRGLFQLRAVGPFEVKGKSEPIAAFEVLGLGEAATPMAIALERGLSPLVGRDQELAQLTACYERLAGNLAQLVAVVGAAGSGKSRLLYEFKQQLAGKDVTFFEARCSSLTQLIPYAPWVNMLRQYFDLTPGEPANSACEKVARKLRSSDKRLDHIHPHLRRILSLAGEDHGNLPAEERKSETFHAVAHLVIHASQTAPVMMIIEDLHWIDDPSREMLELAVTQLHNHRVMLVVSHRPEYQPSWQTHAAFTQLNLHPLSERESIRVIRGLAGGPLPGELERRILFRAEGNPFVTEEITRALVEEGYLVRSNGDIRLTRPAADIRMPDTVQELVGARLDRLGAEAKRVVQVAAVLGRQFHREQLVRLLEAEGIDVPSKLDELERRGVIHRKNMLSKDEFRFGESLTQEVAYEALLLRERRQLHERIGLLLEANTKEPSTERSALLAHHFARSDNREKALDALLRAAREAEQLPSFGAALGFYRQAWHLADAALEPKAEGDERVRRWAMEAALGVCRVIVLYDSPDPGEFEHAAQRGLALAEGLGDATSVASFCTYHGMMMGSDPKRFAQGVGLIEKGLTVARQAGLELPAISISRALAWTYLLDAQFELALRTFDWVVSELEQREGGEGRSDVYISARWMRASARYFSDDLDGALRDLAETHELAVRAPNRTIQSASASTRALLHFQRGEYAEARSWADRAQAIAEAIGNQVRTSSVIALATRVELGEPVDAAKHVDSIEQALAGGGNFLLSIGLITDTFLRLGDLARAERFARLAHERAAGRLREMLCTVALGDVVQRSGPERWAEAQRCYDQAIGLAGTLGARSILARALVGAAEIATARGDHATSAAQLRQALAICQDVRLGRYQTRAERLLAQLDAATERRV